MPRVIEFNSVVVCAVEVVAVGAIWIPSLLRAETKTGRIANLGQRPDASQRRVHESVVAARLDRWVKTTGCAGLTDDDYLSPVGFGPLYRVGLYNTYHQNGYHCCLHSYCSRGLDANPSAALRWIAEGPSSRVDRRKRTGTSSLTAPNHTVFCIAAGYRVFLYGACTPKCLFLTSRGIPRTNA